MVIVSDFGNTPNYFMVYLLIIAVYVCACVLCITVYKAWMYVCMRLITSCVNNSYVCICADSASHYIFYFAFCNKCNAKSEHVYVIYTRT